MLLASTYFFLHYNPQTPSYIRTPPPWVRHTPWSRPLLSPQVHSKRNQQMSTPRYKHSGTPTSSFFFTTQCTLSGTTHTVRPYMYPSMVHSLERTPFRSCTTYTDTSCLTLLMVSSGNTCWDIIPTLSPPMCHTHRFHYRSKM